MPSTLGIVASAYHAAAPGGIADAFDRGDGALGSNWTACQNPLAIAGNKVVIGSNPGSMFWNAAAVAADQFSQADITVSVAGYYMVSAIVRASTPNGGTFYFARLCGSCGDVAIGKRFEFSQTEFASGSWFGTDIPATRKLRLEVQGTTLRAYVNDSLAVETTDASIASGQPGIHISTSNATDAAIDNWSGGAL